MPKPISLDPDRKVKKRKRKKKRKIDYTVYLKPPVIPKRQCVHTTRPMEASQCSQCMNVTPTVSHYPPPTDWWAEDDNEELIKEITLEEFEGDDDGVEHVYVELVDDDYLL